MKSVRSVLIVLSGFLMALPSVLAMNMNAVNEVLKLKNAGIDQETIVAFVQSRNLNYDLSADDAISLRDQGVTAPVLTAMLASGKNISSPPAVAASAAPTAASPTPAPAVAQPNAPVAQPPVVIQAPTPISPGLSPDAAYFCQELSPYGRWILAEDNQWYWQPAVAITTKDWRPYWDRGHWIYTDSGWYWASDYSWGWAVFHYGRWHLHPLHGWIWFPDRVWGPAWVTWRASSEYCGWAPLPPGTRYDSVASIFTFHGKRVDLTFDFGLDWHCFGFVRIREIGEQPRRHFRKEEEIRDVFRRTTVINNYTVVKASGRPESQAKIVNHGLDPERIRAAKGPVVQTVRIEDLRVPTTDRRHERLDSKTKTLEVYRPRFGEPFRR